MKANQASRTARYMAFFRALETSRHKDTRLFDDPYAIHFLDPSLKVVSRLYSMPFARPLIDAIIQQRIPGALASGVARTKYIDHLLCRTIKSGVRQVIVLGAGFDTRSLRLEFLHDLAVLEIDHPDTAVFKMSRLEKQGGLPLNTRYLQHDFNKEGLEELLLRHRIDLSLPTTLLWEGVTNYLSASGVDNTFSLLEKFAARSFLIFTYVDQQVLDHPLSFYKAEKLRKDLDKIEEKWTFGFVPAALPAYLNRYGYSLIEDKGAAGYREKYLSEREHLLKGYEFYHVAFAERKEADKSIIAH